MSESNLEKIEQFFNNDIKIKNLMLEMAITNQDYYNIEYLMKYEKKVFNILNEIEYYLLQIINNFFYNNENEKNRIQKMINEVKQSFINASGNINKLKKVYLQEVTDMRKKFIDSINTNICGWYYTGEKVLEPVTINEFLHLFHHIIVNDETLYQNIDEIPINNFYNKVHLYGKEDLIAYELAEQLASLNLYSDKINILSLKDKILILAKDYGHALSIEISYNGNIADINYFIPKVCNYLKVNTLKGIDKVQPYSCFAKGMFSIKKEDVPIEITDLILKMPTDLDILPLKLIDNENPEQKTILR